MEATRGRRRVRVPNGAILAVDARSGGRPRELHRPRGGRGEPRAYDEMEIVVDLLRALTTILFLGLAATSYVFWRRRRDTPAKWAALSFALLAGVTVGGLLLRNVDGGAREWAGKVLLAALVCFPYCLHRFAAAFTGTSRAVEVPGAV